jgi:hypothetical protein
MRLIEKVLDYIFQDYIILASIIISFLMTLMPVFHFTEVAYKAKLDHELKLAMIAAGQIIEEKK